MRRFALLAVLAIVAAACTEESPTCAAAGDVAVALSGFEEAEDRLERAWTGATRDEKHLLLDTYASELTPITQELPAIRLRILRELDSDPVAMDVLVTWVEANEAIYGLISEALRSAHWADLIGTSPPTKADYGSIAGTYDPQRMDRARAIVARSDSDLYLAIVLECFEKVE